MECSGVLKKKHAECPVEFPRGLTRFCRISEALFCLEFPRRKEET